MKVRSRVPRTELSPMPFYDISTVEAVKSEIANFECEGLNPDSFVSNWVLANGTWNDAGIWEDSAIWND